MRVEKNIYLEQNLYKVTVKIAKKKYTKSFTDVDKAKTFRDKTLELRKNRCKGCGELTHRFNTSYCPKCKKAYSDKLMSLPIKLPSIYIDRLTVDEAPRRSINDNIECKCYKCGRYFEPTRSAIISRIGSLEGKSLGEKHIYCSKSCKSSCDIFAQKGHSKLLLSTIECQQHSARLTQRSSKSDLIKEQIKEFGYVFCERCGKKTEELELHHSEGVADNYNNLDLVLNLNTHILNCKTCHVLTHAACK